MRSKRSSSRLNLSSHAKVRSTRRRNAWMAALNNRCARAWWFAVARIFVDVRDHARIENALAIVRGIKAAIEVELGASQVQPDLLGHLLQGVQTLGKSTMSVSLTGATGTGAKT